MNMFSMAYQLGVRNTVDLAVGTIQSKAKARRDLLHEGILFYAGYTPPPPPPPPPPSAASTVTGAGKKVVVNISNMFTDAGRNVKDKVTATVSPKTEATTIETADFTPVESEKKETTKTRPDFMKEFLG